MSSRERLHRVPTAVVGVDGEAVEPGRISVAPPDHHPLVSDGHLALDRRPRINGYRQAAGGT